MRYDRTDCALMTNPSIEHARISACDVAALTESLGDFRVSFESIYKREFGFCLPAKRICVDDVRVRATGHSRLEEIPTVRGAEGELSV